MLAGGQIDAHAQGRAVGAGLAPERGLPAGLGQDPVADALDRAGLLGQPEELSRLDQATRRVVPAKQRLESHDLAAAEVTWGW